MLKLSRKTGPPMFRWIIMIAGLVLLALVLYACQAPTPTPVPTEPPTEIPSPTATALPDQSAYWADWENGVHGSTYDLGKGPNTYCSRCHSPENWDPEAKVDVAPNCVTCKFATDPELRIATTMDFVEEADWKGIGCAQCHPVDANGIASEEVAWLNTVTDTYEPVRVNNELCEKCHMTSAGVQASGGRGVTHAIALGGSAHANWAGQWPQGHRPDTCTDCHNPHSGEPKTCVDCHEGIADAHTKVAVMLGKVDCMACHDASGKLVGPSNDPAKAGTFVTQEMTVSRSGAVSFNDVHSHSIQWQVLCDRCHKADNPWGLKVYTSTGAVPATPTPPKP